MNFKGRITKKEADYLRLHFGELCSDLADRAEEMRGAAFEAYRDYAAGFPKTDMEVLRRYDLTDSVNGLNIRLYDGRDWSDTYGIHFPEGKHVEVPHGPGMFATVYVGGPETGNGDRVAAIAPIAHELKRLRETYEQRQDAFNAWLETKPLRKAVAGQYPQLCPYLQGYFEKAA